MFFLNLRNKQNCKWFDNDLRSKRKTLVEKGELLSRSSCNPIIRGSYYKCYREYNKLRKYKKRHFKVVSNTTGTGARCLRKKSNFPFQRDPNC